MQKVVAYMQRDQNQQEYFPAIVAAALGESELAVLTAFGELDDAGIVKPIYLTYCRAHAEPLDEFASRDEVLGEEFCTSGEHVVSLIDGSMCVELAFRVDRESLRLWRQAAA